MDDRKDKLKSIKANFEEGLKNLKNPDKFADLIEMVNEGIKDLEDDEKMRYAWFSEQSATKNGYLVYAKSSLHNKDVFISCLTDKPEHGTGWADMKFVGMVCFKDFKASFKGSYPVM